jgi:hypothetical protein
MKTVAEMNPAKTLPGKGLKSLDKRVRTTQDTSNGYTQNSIRVGNRTNKLIERFSKKKKISKAEAFRRFLREGMTRTVKTQSRVIKFLENIQKQCEDSEKVKAAEIVEEIARDSDAYQVFNPDSQGGRK